MKGLFAHLRGNLVAYLALFFALSSGSYAAVSKLLPANSVGTRQVINHSLLRQDFKPSQIPKGARGPRGTTGTRGATGARGPSGPGGTALHWQANADSGDTTTNFATVGPYTLQGRCAPSLYAEVYVLGPDGYFQTVQSDSGDTLAASAGTVGGGTILAASGHSLIGSSNQSYVGHYHTLAEQASIHSAGITVELDYSLIADKRGAGNGICRLDGTAITFPG